MNIKKDIEKFSDNPGVYCIQNKTDITKLYVGKAANLRIRTRQHINNLIRNKDDCPYLQNAWNKYGENDFKIYVLCECELNKCVEKEKYYIKKLKAKVPNGYNLTDGGEGSPGRILSEEFIKKMSESQKKTFQNGRIHPMLGKHHSEKIRKKISENRGDYSGENSWDYGKPKTEDTKRKISLSKVGVKILFRKTTSKYVGVCFDIDAGSWRAYITINRKQIKLGNFEKEIDAVIARDIASIKYYGKDAKINLENKRNYYISQLNVV